jgi:hypothetical protein
MKKILVIGLCAVTLLGCHQTTNQWDIERAAHICGGVEKIVEIKVLMIGKELVTCKNGNIFNLAEAKIR